MQPDQDALRAGVSRLLIAPTIDTAEDPLPGIPAMLTTRLQLELLMQEPAIDLRAVSEVVLADVGATLQILRLIGEEYPCEEDRPTRIADCLVSLDSQSWYAAICGASLANNKEALELWQHFRRVALHARELAAQAGGLSPDEAYLVGLLCELGRLPEVLGWDTYTSIAEHETAGILLADYWRLPAYLLAAIREQQHAAPCSRWNAVLLAAQWEVQQEEQAGNIAARSEK